MKEFIVISSDGQTFDNEGFEVENDQVLDYIEAHSIEEAQLIATDNIEEGVYGAFKDFSIFEKINIKLQNQGLYIFLSSPADLDFVDHIIDDTVAELFYDKKHVLIKGILAIETELANTEELEKDTSINFSSVLKDLLIIEKNEDLEERLLKLSNRKLLKLWREMKNVQWKKNVNYHTKIKDCENHTWL